jgi:DNA-binding MarR family transcriptional regulator
VIYVALTEKAAKVLGDLDEPVTSLHENLMGHLSKAELKELSRLLEKVRERLGGEA